MGQEVGPDTDSNERSPPLFADGSEGEGMRDIDKSVEGARDVVVVVVVMTIVILQSRAGKKIKPGSSYEVTDDKRLGVEGMNMQRSTRVR